MKSTFDTIASMPNSMMNDVTVKPTTETQSQPLNNPMPGTISEDEALKSGAHTQTSITSSGPTVQPLEGTGGTTKVRVGEMFSGETAIGLIDALLPSLMVVLLKYMKLNVRKAELQLTSDEKKTLGPILKNCMDTINLDFSNPWVALSVTAGIIYGSKIIEKAGVGILDKKSEKMDNEKKKSKDDIQPSGTEPANPKMAALAKTQREGVAGTNVQDPKVETTVATQRPNGATYPFGEADILHEMKRLKRGRERAIESLLKAHERATKRGFVK